MAIAAAIADRLGRPAAELERLELELRDADLWAGSLAERAALLLMTSLAGATPDTAADTARAVLELRDPDGDTAVRFVGWLLDSLRTLDRRYASLAFRACLSMELADGLAVRVRFAGEDGQPEEAAFVADAFGYQPHRDRSVGIGLMASGRILFAIGRDLAAIDPPIERRTFPFEVVR